MRISDWSSDVCSSDLYIVLREALKRTHKVGLGQLARRGQEQLVALRPCGKGLVLEVPRYADEVNRKDGYFRHIGTPKPHADLFALAETLIVTTSSTFTAAAYHTHSFHTHTPVTPQKKNPN